MIVDPVQYVGKIGLRIEPVHLGRFDEGHGARQCLSPAVSAGEEPILAADANWPQGAFSGIVVDADAPILQKQAKRRPATEAIAKRLGKVALAWDTRELLLRPDMKGVDLWFAVRLAGSAANVSLL